MSPKTGTPLCPTQTFLNLHPCLPWADPLSSTGLSCLVCHPPSGWNELLQLDWPGKRVPVLQELVGSDAASCLLLCGTQRGVPHPCPHGTFYRSVSKGVHPCACRLCETWGKNLLNKRLMNK